MRKSIFDLFQNNSSIDLDMDRIIELFEDDKIVSVGFELFTLNSFFERFCFMHWKQKGHCLSFSDFCDTIMFESIKQQAQMPPVDTDSVFLLIELVYNVWLLSDKQLKEMNDEGFKCSRKHDYYLLKTIMDDVLKDYNHTIYFDEVAERAIIIEDKPEVTAVAEIIKEDLVVPVIKYNHRTLKGEKKKKKAILISLYHELEPKQKVISDYNNKLEDNLFYLCNNLDIRHNNVDEGHGKYKEYVAKMDKDTLEDWYDELYQMMLLAFLSIDDMENRRQKVNQLKRDIDGK